MTRSDPLRAVHERRLAPAFAALAAFAAVALTTAALSVWFRPPPARGASGEPAIAVLPFANLSGEKENDFFSDGITGEIAIALGKVEGLTVISQTSVMQYKHTSKPLPEIGSELGVGYAIEGSVQRDGERVRITAQLIDAGTDRRLWAERYDRELRDLFAVQTEIAEKIAAALQAQVTPQQRLRMAAGGTTSVEAYDFYLKGRDHLFRFDGTRSVELSMRLLRQALAYDSSYARAWAVLSFAHGNREWFDPEWSDSAEAAARRAIQLDPNLGEAYAALACALRSQRRFRDALPHARRAVELDPNSAAAASILHLVLSGLGRLDEALVWANRAVVLDPTTRDWRYFVGNTYLLLEDSANLRRWVGGYTAQFPDRWEAHLDAARWLLLLGDPAQGERALRLARSLAPDDEVAADVIGHVLVLGRRYDEARPYLERAVRGTTAGVYTPRARTSLALVCPAHG